MLMKGERQDRGDEATMERRSYSRITRMIYQVNDVSYLVNIMQIFSLFHH